MTTQKTTALREPTAQDIINLEHEAGELAEKFYKTIADRAYFYGVVHGVAYNKVEDILSKAVRARMA